MTAPDVTALAAALRQFPQPTTYEEWQAAMDRSWEGDAEAIIVALAAQGWRITSAPDLDRLVGNRQISDAKVVRGVTVGELRAWHRALSAQAAPNLPPHTRLILASEDLLDDFGTRSEAGQRITAEWGPMQDGGWYEPVFTVSGDTEAQRTDAAVRAALDGLRAEWDKTQGGEHLRDIIDARLAALDA